MITITGRPITKKNNWHPYVRGKRMLLVPSKRWKDFEKSALKQLEGIHDYYGEEVDVMYLFRIKGNFNIDLDNAIGGINDILQKAHIIENDKNIVSMSAVKERGCEEWETQIIITSLL